MATTKPKTKVKSKFTPAMEKEKQRHRWDSSFGRPVLVLNRPLFNSIKVQRAKIFILNEIF